MNYKEHCESLVVRWIAKPFISFIVKLKSIHIKIDTMSLHLQMEKTCTRSNNHITQKTHIELHFCVAPNRKEKIESQNPRLNYFDVGFWVWFVVISIHCISIFFLSNAQCFNQTWDARVHLSFHQLHYVLTKQVIGTHNPLSLITH